MSQGFRDSVRHRKSDAYARATRFSALTYASAYDELMKNLSCQIGTSSSGWGGRRTLPWAFTEQGVAMLSSVLRSPQAAVVNIEITRAFVRLREMIGTHADLARRLDELERRFREHDEQFVVVFDAIRQLMTPAKSKPRELGYHTLTDRK